MEPIRNIRNLPELDLDSIHVWGVQIPDVVERLDLFHGVLSREEREKAGLFRREADRHSSVVARGALRFLLSAYTGIDAVEIGFQYSENGKPSLMSCGGDTPAAFNVSHSADWVVLAFGRDRHVGVDVEKIKRNMDILSIASRYFAPEETALMRQADDQYEVFFQLWACKEAYLKARGSGVFREMGRSSIPIVDGRLPEVAEKDGWIFHRLEAGSQYAAAVVTDRKLSNIPCYDFASLDFIEAGILSRS